MHVGVRSGASKQASIRCKRCVLRGMCGRLLLQSVGDRDKERHTESYLRRRRLLWLLLLLLPVCRNTPQQQGQTHVRHASMPKGRRQQATTSTIPRPLGRVAPPPPRPPPRNQNPPALLLVLLVLLPLLLLLVCFVLFHMVGVSSCSCSSCVLTVPVCCRCCCRGATPLSAVPRLHSHAGRGGRVSSVLLVVCC